MNSTLIFKKFAVSNGLPTTLIDNLPGLMVFLKWFASCVIKHDNVECLDKWLWIGGMSVKMPGSVSNWTIIRPDCFSHRFKVIWPSRLLVKLRCDSVQSLNDRLLRRALFAEPKSSWKRPSGGQFMTWQRNMKSLTEGLSRVGNVRLAGWGPRDPSHLWLETLSDMASSRSQWRSCTFSLALSS